RVVRGGNVEASEVGGTVLAIEELLPHYQLVVDRRATLATLEVRVEPAPALVERCGGFDAAHPLIVGLRQRVAERLRMAIGLSVPLTIVAPQTIPRPQGK